MNPHEAKAELGDALFLDVREPYEWDSGHVEGSLHIPIGQLNERVDELDSARKVVVVCQVGQRSELVANWLSEQGFDAHNLEGGLVAWITEGLPLITSTDGGGEVIDGWARDLTGKRLNPDPGSD
jgi:rhodanese-related sulfurtransferase